MQLTGNIKMVQGNIFETEMQTIAIPVNLMGVMGKGLALKFKQKYPELYQNYKSLCDTRKLTFDRPWLDLHYPDQFFLYFATKDHWRKPSQLSYIDRGLRAMRENYADYGSVALPALGCGLGGLKFEDVADLVYVHLGDLYSFPVEIYQPF